MYLHLIVTSMQCVTTPRDPTSVLAMKDFTKMDKTAPVTKNTLVFC